MSNAWTARVWKERHARNLSPAAKDVLLTLRTYRGNGGLICPSHATLAGRAACSERTVQRALKQGQILGLVSWIERRVSRGWRWLRTSNSYRLHLPGEPVQPRRRRTNGQFGRGGESQEKQEARESRKAALGAMLQAAVGLPDLLAARRAAFVLTPARGACR